MTNNLSDHTGDEPGARATGSGRRPIRSYVVRGGRLTTSQQRALESYSADYVVPFHAAPLNPGELFGNNQPLVVEIGFGMGDSLLAMAKEQADKNFLGIEVHKPGIGKLLLGIAEQGISNIRIINHDAREVMESCFGAGTVDGIQVFFPDPWHKKRHHKRRLIQTPFVNLLVSRLKPGGMLHLATDWEPYAEQLLEVLEANDRLHNCAGTGNYATPGDRPVTKFERRGRKLGHGVWDLRFTRCTD
ncbi:MAG: tRNA (guanosine(46)-N7)-methyltransferase TrmB [Pseudomonadales bacterium]|nr:tRNA (guanosine(46)-N7)-methyltransferase TrmB [Pseudomonadales bacterium]